MSELSARLLRAMYLAKDPDDFCNRLTNDVLVECGAVAAYIAVLLDDATISMIGSWGYPASRRAVDDRPLLSARMAVTDTIKSGEIQAFNTWEEYLTAYPGLSHRAAPGASFIAIPMLESGTRFGALGLTFKEALTDVQLREPDWRVLAIAAQVFVTRIVGMGRGTVESVAELGSEGRLNLTERELLVLKRSAAGATVREIARDLHVSESTIKKTRMAIYSKLRISGRSDLQYAADVLAPERPR